MVIFALKNGFLSWLLGWHFSAKLMFMCLRKEVSRGSFFLGLSPVNSTLGEVIPLFGFSLICMFALSTSCSEPFSLIGSLNSYDSFSSWSVLSSYVTSMCSRSWSLVMMSMLTRCNVFMFFQHYIHFHAFLIFRLSYLWRLF